MTPKTSKQLAVPVKRMSIQQIPAAHIITNQIHNKAGIMFTREDRQQQPTSCPGEFFHSGTTHCEYVR